MMSDSRGEGGSKMTPKNWIIEGKNRIKGGRGSKMTQKNRTSFMHDPKVAPERPQAAAKQNLHSYYECSREKSCMKAVVM